MEEKMVLGVDVGASGIKGGIVNVVTGELLTERIRLETPQPATPERMAQTFTELIKLHDWKGRVGCGFPAIVKKGVAHSAANIDDSWIGTNIEKLFTETSGCKVKALNDADAAGLAEMKFGIGKGRKGVNIMITIGSGLGSALFINEKLFPNTEFGHVYLKGQQIIAEQFASNKIRKDQELSWEEWAGRFNEYLMHLEKVLNPDLFILGGGGSKKFEKFSHLLTLSTPVEAAQLLNDAGTIGAAYFALKKKRREENILLGSA